MSAPRDAVARDTVPPDASPVEAPHASRPPPGGIVIVGGGWAGLSAAVELARHGLRPVLLEAARQLGGRARAVRFDALHVDNGQHLLFGAYHSLLAMLRVLDVPESRAFRRLPLNLLLRSATGADIRFAARSLPAPWHLGLALLATRGLELSARLSALRFLRRVRRAGFHVTPDRALADFLRQQNQGGEETRALWQPLCQAALNTPLAEASTQLFLRVLRDAFFGNRRDSDFLLPVSDLTACLPQPAMDFVESRGGSVRLAARVQAIRVDAGAVSGVLVHDAWLDANQVVVATPPEACAELLREHAPLADTVASLERLSAQPICTLYLQYPGAVTLGRDFIGVLDATVHWLFDHGRLTGRPGLIAAVINGPGPHMDLAGEALTDRLVGEIARLFPAWPTPRASKLIREKRATLSASAGVDQYRPGHATAVRGLWLAGDYTATGYPSTLEGAVRSGLLCARRILRHTRQVA
jgi:squalene-associated FAD-dependent desaturase